MDDVVKDDVPMLNSTNSSSERDEYYPNRRFSQTNRSISISIPVTSIELSSGATSRVGLTGPLHSDTKTPKEPVEQEYIKSQRGDYDNNNNEAKNEHLLRSGRLGMCNNPYCTTCPTSYYNKRQLISRVSDGLDHRFSQHQVGEGGKRWVQEKLSLIKHFTFGVMNPHAKVVQQWNQFIVISCLFAIFIDPLFFYLLSVEKGPKCIVINWPMTKAIVVFRSITDLLYFMNMLVQFRLAFISPESRVVGAGDLVDHPGKIALHYLSGFFILDLFIVLPLPQIIVLCILPNSIASSGANYAKNLLRAAVLVQYIPRLYRFLPLLAGQSPSGFIFESAWANFVINLLTFVLAGHVVGSCWYLFGLQRVNQCFREACRKSGIINCMQFIDCGHGNDFGRFEADTTWIDWKNNENSTACFSEDGFPYGIYVKAVNLTAEQSIITRYIYSFFWGFQQISTLAGNQTPSYFVWEVLFTSGIIGLGLLLFALLIGNMQNFLQGLGRRRLEMSLRRRDIEQWMSHRHLPENLRRGELVSVGEDGNKVPLSDGDVCGEELLIWCLEHSYLNGDSRNEKKPQYRLVCNRTVKCLTNVEAFVLRAADLEEVTTLFAGFLKNHRVQIAIRNKSPYWRGFAATTIQAAWRYRKKRLSWAANSHGRATLHSKFI